MGQQKKKNSRIDYISQDQVIRELSKYQRDLEHLNKCIKTQSSNKEIKKSFTNGIQDIEDLYTFYTSTLDEKLSEVTDMIEDLNAGKLSYKEEQVTDFLNEKEEVFEKLTNFAANHFDVIVKK